jgi:signal recognition particle receptor subunit beta
VPILVLANKQDAKGALKEEQISTQYSLHEIRDHSWRLQPCSALERTGVEEALDWLTDELVKKM